MARLQAGVVGSKDSTMSQEEHSEAQAVLQELLDSARAFRTLIQIKLQSLPLQLPQLDLLQREVLFRQLLELERNGAVVTQTLHQLLWTLHHAEGPLPATAPVAKPPEPQT